MLSLLSLLAAVIARPGTAAAITVIPATAITVTQATTQPTTATAGAATIGLGGGIATTADIMAAGMAAGGAAVAGAGAGGAADTADTAGTAAAAVIGTVDPIRSAPSPVVEVRSILTLSFLVARPLAVSRKHRVKGELLSARAAVISPEHAARRDCPGIAAAACPDRAPVLVAAQLQA
jgi:hypothetical protein